MPPMPKDASHIKKIAVVSNTHWDREFRRSFEKTRRALVTMLDVTLDILERDPAYHSFTMDGHAIMIDDYLEVRPERRALVESLIARGRLIIGPYFTLAEEFSISHEPLLRNLLWGRRTVEKYGGKTGTVAYTPSSWGQTGQLPQILADFGLTKMMFYRGISHHESDAEFIWEAPDGTQVLASRFAVYARYNWYYQVHRAVTRGRTFAKDYAWGEFDEVPFRAADGDDASFTLLSPEASYDGSGLAEAIEAMVQAEGTHFTTDVFLAMNGHDISVAFPLESRIIQDARKLLAGKYSIEHTDLEGFWTEAQKTLDRQSLPVLRGERRSYLKQGMWTYLFPGTISARTYLKQRDFAATTRLVYHAEPMAALARAFGADYPVNYLERGWRYLLSNHTHDANGGCAPDAVCADMEYRYRKACDLGDIVVEDAMAHLARNLSPAGLPQDVMLLVAYNPLPFARDAVTAVDLEIPRRFAAKSVSLLEGGEGSGEGVERQPILQEKSSVFVDSIWDVPTILETMRHKFYARLTRLPALGYRVYTIRLEEQELRSMPARGLAVDAHTLENEFLRAEVNANGTVDILHKPTGRHYRNLNCLTDQGEAGNAWKHAAPCHDRKYNSLGVAARIALTENGPLVGAVTAEYEFLVPEDYADGKSRSEKMTALPVRVEYRLEKGARWLRVMLTLENRAKDHWLRASFPTGLAAGQTWADSHFDVLARPIALPDSTGWVEEAGGTHPLRTFVDINDGQEGMALLSKGLYEYEAFEDEQRTLSLTLLRACRIKLAVSEEKQTELPDPGVQCPGPQRFEYAICPHAGDWADANLLNLAAEFDTPIHCAMSGRGRGDLPPEASLFSLNNIRLHVTCVKQAEDGRGLIVRLFNPLETPQPLTLSFGKLILAACRCRMDETDAEPLSIEGNAIVDTAGQKKIATYRIAI